MKTIRDYLAQPIDERFLKRRSLQQKIGTKIPGALAKWTRKAIWPAGFKHLRNFDHDYTFTRVGTELTTMEFRGQVVKSLKPFRELITSFDGPAALVTLGPSAKEYDWDKLKQSGKRIIAVSGGGAFLKGYGITPDLLVVSDPDFSKSAGFNLNATPEVPLLIEFRAAVELHRHHPEALEGRPVTVIERVNKWYGLPALSTVALEEMNERSGSPFRISAQPDRLGRIGWSHQLELGFFPSTTVAIVALQVMIGLGATDIEIVGMDLGGGNSLYQGVGTSRLAEQYQSVILPSFQVMSEALQGRGIRVHNVSPRCPLPPEIFRNIES